MKKYLGLAAVIGTVGLALACSVTATGTGTDGGTGSSSGDNDGGTSSGNVDSGVKKDTGVKETAPLTCYEADKAGTYKSAAPALNQGKATSTDLNDFFMACFDTAATQATCDAYVGTKAAPLHTAVVNCVFPFYNPALDQATLDTLPPAALIPSGESGLVLNVNTCRALAVNAPAGCAQKFTDSEICIRGACDTCEDDAGFSACITEAEGTGCKTYIPEAACTSAVTAGAAAADALCGPAQVTYSDNAKFKTSYTAIATAFCGSAQ